MSLRAGDWVRVRSKPEILATLDERGCLDGLPFMPEMLQFCGMRFQVWTRAHKTCDTVSSTGGRRMHSAVHLNELRCDGRAHGGCDSACLLFWKEAWLERVSGPGPDPALEPDTPKSLQGRSKPQRTEQLLLDAAVEHGEEGQPARYRCQATELPSATRPLKWWDMRQYVEDLTSGNVPVSRLASGAVYAAFRALVTRAERRSTRLPRLLIQLYDGVQRMLHGTPYPRRRGTIAPGHPTPAAELGLAPGELVRVRPYDQILGTLDTRNLNRGMYFDAEEVPFCGKTFRVRSRVERIIDERTGRMITLKGKNVILEGVWCQGRYSDRRMLCPRAIFPIWREIWLERPDEAAAHKQGSAPDARA